MAALTATIPSNTGTASPGGNVASSDTINVNVMGRNGAILEILNGNASPDSMTFTDSGSSPSGNPVTTYAASVTNGTNKVFLLKREQANTTTGNITVTHSVTTTVTYKLYPI